MSSNAFPFPLSSTLKLPAGSAKTNEQIASKELLTGQETPFERLSWEGKEARRQYTFIVACNKVSYLYATDLNAEAFESPRKMSRFRLNPRPFKLAN